MEKGIAGNQRGTVLVTFALLLMALLGFVALAIEVGDWYVTRAELSKAVDAAALAGATNIASPNLNLVALAQDFGDANFAPGYMGTVASGSGAASYAATATTNQMTVTGNVSSYGLITSLFGVTTIPISSTGAAQKNEVEIMLILDCSGSMAGTPISNLKTAATNFLSYFEPSQSEDMMGLVTFSTAATVKVPLETNFASAIQSVINSLTANGGTNSADAVADAGAQLPVQTGTPNADWKQQFVVFFTDGEPTCFTSTFKHANASANYVVCTSYERHEPVVRHLPLSGEPDHREFRQREPRPDRARDERVDLQSNARGYHHLLDELGDAVCRLPSGNVRARAGPLYCRGLLRYPPGQSRAAQDPRDVRPQRGRADGPEQRRVAEGERGDDLHDRARGRRRHRYDLPEQSIERA